MRQAAAIFLCAIAVAAARAANPVATFDTSQGTFQVELLADLAPNTVSNFLSFVDNGEYNNTFIHRTTTVSYDGLAVVQGGGYSITGAPFNGTNPPTHIDFSNHTILHSEYSAQAPNAVGTLAMALTGGSNGPNGDSATTEWFFNVNDNSQTLGPSAAQNGVGYTVFGRVLGNGMQVVDQIQQLQRLEDVLGVAPANAGGLGIFGPIPTVNFDSSMSSLAVSNLVTVNSITVPRVVGDANLDGVVNALDIADIVAHWRFRQSYNIGDVNRDGVVDAVDIAMTVNNWNSRTPTPNGLPASAGGSGASAAATAVAVPEPSTVVLLTAALAMFALRVGRRP